MAKFTYGLVWRRRGRGTGSIMRVADLLRIFLGVFVVGAHTVAAPATDGLVDLKTLFVEAEDEVRLTPVPHLPKQYYAWPPIFWLDNQRLIMSVRELGAWKAEKDEHAKIVVVDVDRGTVEETAYRGRLVCLGPDRDMLIEDYPDPTPDYRRPGDAKEDRNRFLKGKVGGPLTPFRRPPELGILNTYTCEYYNNRAHSFGEGYILGKLRSGDGEVFVTPPYSSPDNKVYMVGPDGKVRWTRERDPCTTGGGGGYKPWLGKYFSGVSWGRVTPGCMNLNRDSRLYSKEGTEDKPLPTMIQELRRRERKSGANGTTYWARPGFYVFVHYSRELGVDGLYRQNERSGQLKRVLKKPWGLDMLSPNGCRNLVLAETPTIIELCKGNEQ